jgi:hypothetical protein
VDDLQRTPGARDRDPLAARIRRAWEQGRIGEADRDIRLRNVASAQSRAELDLIARDLDELDAALPAAQPVPAWSEPGPSPAVEELSDLAVQAAKGTARSLAPAPVAVLVLLFALVGIGAAVYVTSRPSHPAGGLLTPGQVATDEAGPPPVEPSGPSDSVPSESSVPGASYALTGPGITAFLAGYRARFGTTRVVDLTLYDGYAVVQVPGPGRHRHTGFLFRPQQGWTDFGGVSADFPGARRVDLSRLDVAALTRNISRARRALNVEHPTTTYVIVRQYAPADAVPSVDIHVTNELDESGYLATRLDGTVERAYPHLP